ncbi:hypothetical protein NE237_018385 [Protea cynaroides]|uniref:Uncharacterized protein n=1 Tax=Protea cynaroides TaxID=273540 RepID=A0A9Q0K9S9_9MAGN|nr:hypothetical protein NE237_018385 [Protea cynaroides]
MPGRIEFLSSTDRYPWSPTSWANPPALFFPLAIALLRVVVAWKLPSLQIKGKSLASSVLSSWVAMLMQEQRSSDAKNAEATPLMSQTAAPSSFRHTGMVLLVVDVRTPFGFKRLVQLV